MTFTPAEYDRLITYLKNTYNIPLYTHDDHAYPAALLRPHPSQINDVDSILSEAIPATHIDSSSLAVYDRAHLQRLMDSGAQLTDDIAFIADTLSYEPLQLSAKLSRYFDMIATCDALDQELRAYARGERDSAPLRDSFHAVIATEEIFHSGRGRAAIIGAATCTVFSKDGADHVIVVQRAQNLATGAGLYHVLPAFVLQPTGPESFYAVEWSLKHQLLREFGEELFGLPEYHQWQNPDGPTYFYQHPAVADLREMLADGRASLYLTGSAMNLLTLRPEVCMLLKIRDAGWYERWQNYLHDAAETERQQTHYIPLDTLDGLPQDLPYRLTPQGAVSLWEGIRLARTLP